MRVLLVSPTGVPGGAERALAGLARCLPDSDIVPNAVLLQRGPLEGWLQDAGCPVEVFDAGRTREAHRTALTVGRLARRARNFDVVVSNQSKGHVYGGVAARLAARPAIWWQQGIPEPSPIERVAARVPVDVVVASSREAVAAQVRLTPRRRVELVHLGVDVAAVRARGGTGKSLVESHAWGSGPLIGIVGRLEPWKGQDVFLRAAARVAESQPDATFLVVGGAILGWEGGYPNSLRELAAELGITNQVHFVGHQNDVYPWFDALDVVVHASFGEPFGLVLVEAMALGKPLIATAAGGPTEIIEEGISGLLVSPGDHEAMAESIMKVLRDGALKTRLAHGAQARAAHFDESVMARAYAQILNEVVRREHPTERS